MGYPDFFEDTGLFLALRERLAYALPDYSDHHYLIAFSGGADSMFLAYFFIWLRKRDSLSFSLAHFNHQLRPGMDEEESLLLNKFAADWKIPYFEETADVLGLAKERKAGIEEAARFARHAFFVKLTDRLKAELKTDKVLITTGHNLDDLCETIILNLGRGTGPSGLSSMPYFDGSIIRPLLILEKERIRQFLDEGQLSYFLDHTNESPVYLRNRIRHELLPLWEEILGYYPGQQLFSLSENLRVENEALKEIAAEIMRKLLLEDGSLNLHNLQQYPQGIYYRIIQAWLSDIHGHPAPISRRSFSKLEKKLRELPARAEYHIGRGKAIKIQNWRLVFEKISKNRKD